MHNHYETIDGVLFLDLDSIFDQNGEHIDDYEKYQKLESIQIILFRTQTHPIKIGNSFLYNCKNLTTIDLSHLFNVISIGNGFLYNCKNLTTLDLSFLSNVTSIGNGFLYNCKNLTTIELSPLSNVTSIGNVFLSNCSNLTTIDLSHLSNVTSIGNFFLSDCVNLTTINLSHLSNVTSIGNCFLYTCKNLTAIYLYPLSNVTSIGNFFLSCCSNLTMIDLSSLSNVTTIGECFLYNCSKLTTIDLSSLSNVTSIGDNFFLSDCSKLTTIIINDEVNEQLIKKINKLKNVKFVHKNSNCFSNYHDDLEKIRNNKKFAQKLLKYLAIPFNKKRSHNQLLKKLKLTNKQHHKKMPMNKLPVCRNEYDIFTFEEIKNIPLKKLVFIEKINDTYNAFDVVQLRKHIFDTNKNKYNNPLTTNKICEDDLEKILKVNMRQINYFII